MRGRIRTSPTAGADDSARGQALSFPPCGAAGAVVVVELSGGRLAPLSELPVERGRFSRGRSAGAISTSAAAAGAAAARLVTNASARSRSLASARALLACALEDPASGAAAAAALVARALLSAKASARSSALACAGMALARRAAGSAPIASGWLAALAAAPAPASALIAPGPNFAFQSLLLMGKTGRCVCRRTIAIAPCDVDERCR